MVANIVNLLSKAIMSNNVQKSTSVSTVSNNPFASPFVTSATSKKSYSTYAKNNPVQGGYFAGYYNNKPNIVGQRLFVSV